MSVITNEPERTEVILEHANEAEHFLKQLANKTRLMVLTSLVGKELSVSDLLTRIDVTQPVLSQHLALLREAKMVATRRDGQVIYYRLTDERVHKVLGLINTFYPASMPD
ncbi:ArsR/SmtB family transcription factor [Salinimonas sediminis]|uniref:ArsR family transcriptional regulator n=1 Tax=Salinimonas sediminis TaxID=2303538 RepID=A0A346NN45_9ALTE|nr:metalloregulator ArsR/SmtB family transcription factor [Salinimonas sediminis]AXR06952.1 ArsR family transcriptional regulator [Salinimonas sediminis]